MNDVLDTVEYKGYKIDIYGDDCAEDPRRWDCLGSIAMFNPDHLGDRNGKYGICSSHASFLESSEARDAAFIFELDFRDHGASCDLSAHAEISEIVRTTHAIHRMFPCTCSESDDGVLCKNCQTRGITTYDIDRPMFEEEFYENVDGYLFVTREKVEENYSKLSKAVLERARQAILVELAIYSEWLTGECYGYKILTNGDWDEDEELDSCWGFYGYSHKESGLLESAQSAIDHHIEYEWKRKMKRLWKLNSNKRSRIYKSQTTKGATCETIIQ